MGLPGTDCALADDLAQDVCKVKLKARLSDDGKRQKKAAQDKFIKENGYTVLKTSTECVDDGIDYAKLWPKETMKECAIQAYSRGYQFYLYGQKGSSKANNCWGYLGHQAPYKELSYFVTTPDH